jgi:hypothetical protein
MLYYAGQEMWLRCRFLFSPLRAVLFVYRYVIQVKVRFQMIIPKLAFQCQKEID